MIDLLKKVDGREVFKTLVVLFAFGVPLILWVVGISIFTKPTEFKPEISEKEIISEGELVPSKILNNKQDYNQQELVIRGKVVFEPVVCEKKECPPGDSCCGCPEKRNLAIADAGTILTPRTKGRLKLLDYKGRPFCQRRESSCDYVCQDWAVGAIYDVGGVFFAEPPPPGWNLSLNYYFLAEGKKMLKKAGLGETLGIMIGEVKEILRQLTTSGYYVLE